MSASPQPLITRKTRSYKRPKRRKQEYTSTTPPINPPLRVTPSPTESVEKKKTSLPSHIRSLNALQQGLSIVSLLLMGSALGFYAWTTYVPRVWDKEYSKLEKLERYERYLLTTNETLKQQLAQQAEKPQSGLINAKPEQAIFLPSNPKSVTIPEKNSLTDSEPLKVSNPVAY